MKTELSINSNGSRLCPANEPEKRSPVSFVDLVNQDQTQGDEATLCKQKGRHKVGAGCRDGDQYAVL